MVSFILLLLYVKKLYLFDYHGKKEEKKARENNQVVIIY